MVSTVLMLQTSVLGFLCIAALICRQGVSLELQHNSQTVPNNSLLALTGIGALPSSVLRCLSLRVNCCSSADTTDGLGLGDWFLPNNTNLVELQNTSADADFYLERGSGRLDLFRRNNAMSPEGLFYCEVPLSSGESEQVYVGLYLAGNGEL